MRLVEARATVTGMLTNYKPTTDFPVPKRQLDFLLFQAASDLYDERRHEHLSAIAGFPSWTILQILVSDFELDPNPNCIRYYATLPFNPTDLFFPIRNLNLVKKNPIVVQPVRPTTQPMVHYMTEMPPSESEPVAILMAHLVYLQAGNRDLSAFDYLQFEAVITSPRDDLFDFLNDQSIIPIPGGMEKKFLENATKLVAETLFGKQPELVEDNIQK